MTWEQIVAVEPRIQELFDRISMPHEQDEYEWTSVKMEFTNLVGFYAEQDNELLFGHDAYDIVYDKMFNMFWRGHVDSEAS